MPTSIKELQITKEDIARARELIARGEKNPWDCPICVAARRTFGVAYTGSCANEEGYATFGMGVGDEPDTPYFSILGSRYAIPQYILDQVMKPFDNGLDPEPNKFDLVILNT